VSQGVILGILVLVIGLIYVTQGTKATSYDYELSNVDGKIAELEAEIEDLQLERARLTSIASMETNEVAATMVDGVVSGYAE
jgi:anthranilate phosphoribosyltransferase